MCGPREIELLAQQEKSLPGHHHCKTSAVDLSSLSAGILRYFTVKYVLFLCNFPLIKLDDRRTSDGLAQ